LPPRPRPKAAVDGEQPATKRFEFLVSILGIVVGLIGIYLTVLSFPSALDALGAAFSGTPLPKELTGLGGAILVFVITLTGLLLFLVLFVALGNVVSFALSWHGVPYHRWIGFALCYLLFLLSGVLTIYFVNRDALASVVGVGIVVHIMLFFVIGFVGMTIEESKR
jgi:hypothetical protein